MKSKKLYTKLLLAGGLLLFSGSLTSCDDFLTLLPTDQLPEEDIENYANEILKKGDSVDALVERSIDRKLAVALKGAVKLNEKEISVEDFNKMMQE